MPAQPFISLLAGGPRLKLDALVHARDVVEPHVEVLLGGELKTWREGSKVDFPVREMPWE